MSDGEKGDRLGDGRKDRLPFTNFIPRRGKFRIGSKDRKTGTANKEIKMAIKRRLQKLEKTSQGGSPFIGAESEEDYKKKLAKYKEKYPHRPEPKAVIIKSKIIRSREDLE